MPGRSMHLPFGPATGATGEPSELPEVVPIEELSPRALDTAAREIAEEQPAPTGPEEKEDPPWPTATG